MVPEHQGVDSELSPWQHNFSFDAHVVCAVAFGTPGFVFVNPELRAKCGAPQYGQAEPVLMISYHSLYSDTYKCLTQHSTVIHLQQVKWITDAKLRVFPNISQNTIVEALKQSMQAKVPGVDLFAQQAASATLMVDGDLLYSAAVLCVDTSKLYHNNGTLQCRCQYVADQVVQLNRLTVADALKMHYDNTKGVKKRYK